MQASDRVQGFLQPYHINPSGVPHCARHLRAVDHICLATELLGRCSGSETNVRSVLPRNRLLLFSFVHWHSPSSRRTRPAMLASFFSLNQQKWHVKLLPLRTLLRHVVGCAADTDSALLSNAASCSTNGISVRPLTLLSKLTWSPIVHQFQMSRRCLGRS